MPLPATHLANIISWSLWSERGTVIASMITTAAALPMHSDTNLELLCFDPASTDLPTVFQGTGSDHQKERKVYSPSAVYSIYNGGLSDKAYGSLLTYKYQKHRRNQLVSTRVHIPNGTSIGSDDGCDQETVTQTREHRQQ